RSDRGSNARAARDSCDRIEPAQEGGSRARPAASFEVTVVKAHGVAFALALSIGPAACHHPVHHPGEEFLEAIKFEGNRSISADDLRDGLALHQVQEHGAAPDPYLVAVDGDRIRGMYLRHGFLEVDVHSR